MYNKSYHSQIWVYILVLMASVCTHMRLEAGIIHQQDFATSDFDIWNVTAPNGDSYSRLSGRDMFGGGEIGEPELPCKVIRLLVPDNAYDFKITIEEIGVASPFILDNPIYPVQKPIPINDYTDDMFTFPDEDTYRTLKTQFRAEVLEESRLEGKYHIVAVGLWPLAYSKDPQQLELCTSIRINLDYKENTIFKQRSSNVETTSFINISDIVVNADAVKSISISPSDAVSGGGVVINQKLPRYYIISERSLIPALEDLATWKTQKGYCVVTKAIEDIYADTRYKVGTNGIVDEAASLRKYLQDEYGAHGTFFCFLVGDHRTRIPIRKVVDFTSTTSVNNPNGDHFIPTDNYFSDLSDDSWSLFKEANNLYVSNYETTYNPYIYVGRLLCHSMEEINNYTKKLILYESNPGRGNSDYLTEAMIVVQIDGKDYYDGTLQEMSNTFDSVVALIDSKIANKNADYYPTGETVIKQMNRSGYNSLMGHGEPGTIQSSGENRNNCEYIKALNNYKYDNDATKSQTNLSKTCYNNGLDLMTNYDSPSVVYTISCTTMPFDVYSGWRDIFDLPHTMASSYTVGGAYGGVAYIGNTRSGYWPDSPELEVLFLQQLHNNPQTGIAEAISKNIYNVEVPSPIHTDYRRKIRHAHNLIGDPEFKMWTRNPSNLNAYVFWDNANISVGGPDAVGSTVVVNNGEGNIRLYNVNQSQPPVMYSGGGKMEAVGVYKTGFLPIVKLDCYNDSLKNCNRKFVLREAQLGCMESSSVVIGQNANIDVRAVDNISTGAGLNILSEGNLSLRCDKQISLEGTEIDTGGQLTVQGETVTLSKGFSVKAGGTLTIKPN